MGGKVVASHGTTHSRGVKYIMNSLSFLAHPCPVHVLLLCSILTVTPCAVFSLWLTLFNLLFRGLELTRAPLMPFKQLSCKLQQFANMLLCRSYTPIWVCQHKLANISLTCEGPFILCHSYSVLLFGRLLVVFISAFLVFHVFFTHCSFNFVSPFALCFFLQFLVYFGSCISFLCRFYVCFIFTVFVLVFWIFGYILGPACLIKILFSQVDSRSLLFIAVLFFAGSYSFPLVYLSLFFSRVHRRSCLFIGQEFLFSSVNKRSRLFIGVFIYAS